MPFYFVGHTHCKQFWLLNPVGRMNVGSVHFYRPQKCWNFILIYFVVSLGSTCFIYSVIPLWFSHKHSFRCPEISPENTWFCCHVHGRRRPDVSDIYRHERGLSLYTNVETQSWTVVTDFLPLLSTSWCKSQVTYSARNLYDLYSKHSYEIYIMVKICICSHLELRMICEVLNEENIRSKSWIRCFKM